MREKSNGVFSGQGGFFHIAATNKRARQRRRWMAAPCGDWSSSISDAAAARERRSRERAGPDAAAADGPERDAQAEQDAEQGAAARDASRRAGWCVYDHGDDGGGHGSRRR